MSRQTVVWAILVAFGGCATSSAGHPPAAEETDAGRTPDSAVVTPADAGGMVDAMPPAAVPRLRDLAFRCKLISDRNIDDPTPNDAHGRANLRGTDLGIPVAHGEDLYVFFGDTAGAEVIWPIDTESLPDAVGYTAVPYAQVAANPALLCNQLRFLVTGDALGSAESDFAGAWMTPPSGESIADYIHNPAGPRGMGMFPNMPGDFEVPTGAFSYGGSIYLFYTIINEDPFEMRGSYLARWITPATDGFPTYDILYHVDHRFDATGPLGGDFIHIAPLVVGNYLYLYGTGEYRASPVHLARKPMAMLHTAGGFERWDAATETWVGPRDPAAPIVAAPDIGELSVQYVPALDRYVMLDQEVNLGNRIAARFAVSPRGPWSEAVTVANMTDPAFAARHCCVGTDCPGERMMQCDRGSFYGTYMLPDAIENPDGSVSITFLVSTWVPYNVALMTATFEL